MNYNKCSSCEDDYWTFTTLEDNLYKHVYCMACGFETWYMKTDEVDNMEDSDFVKTLREHDRKMIKAKEKEQFVKNIRKICLVMFLLCCVIAGVAQCDMTMDARLHKNKLSDSLVP